MIKAAFYLFLIIIILLGAYLVTNPSRPSMGSLVLIEASTPLESQSSAWWLIFGGLMYTDNGTWRTLHGDLGDDDELRKLYLRTNPLDTDNGYHPQNIFRLISKKDYGHSTQEIRFIIDKDQESLSPNRNDSSGFFLIENYSNIDNFYQIGIEMDGQATIRKKSKGIYSTLEETQIWGEKESYDPELKQNLLPQKEVIDLKVEKIETSEGLALKLLINNELVLEAQDKEILPGGKIGIRSDFMDITIEDYLLDNVSVVRQGAN